MAAEGQTAPVVARDRIIATAISARAPRVPRPQSSAFATCPAVFSHPVVVRPPRPTPAGADAPIALELFNTVPGRAIVHAADDNRNAPLIRKGEIVIVESDFGRAGWLPTEGGLFLIEYVSGPYTGELYARRTRDIVQTFTNRLGQWHAGSIRRGACADGVFYCDDGPYRDELHLAGKLIGKVIGLYRPSCIGSVAA